MAAKRETKRIQGIVIRRSDYRDNDLMIEILSPEGKKSFLARGAKKSGSKNAALLNLLSEGEFSVVLSPNGHLSLQEGVLLSLADGHDDLMRLGVYGLLAELSRFLVGETKEGESFAWLSKSLKAIREGYDPLSAALIYMAFLLKKNGYGLCVDRCVRCGAKKGISGLSYQDGGFLCQKHLREGEKRDVYTLKVIRYCYMLPLLEMGKVAFEKKVALTLLREWAQNIEEWLGIKLRSIELLSLF